MGIYTSNWLRLSTAQKKDLGITEVADAPTYDFVFIMDGSAKALMM